MKNEKHKKWLGLFVLFLEFFGILFVGFCICNAMTVAIDDTSLLWDSEEIRGGRFELYPTKNMYNFILIDTEKGYTYQVQWHTEVNKRFRVPIY